MATDQLTATGNSQSQTTAQGSSLQPTGQASGTGATSTNLQPGTATSLLSSGQGGVSLHGTALSTVNLNAPAASTSSTAVTKPVQTTHHASPVLLAFPAALVVVALVLFWTTSRSVKSTT
ncbi:MAG TPA: hypothetical protein VII55_01455 [Candidatus Saccharimonadales bacterium]